MQLINPEPGAVPRGTSARIWRHPFEPHEFSAIEAGLKTQFRDVVRASNSRATRDRKFGELDLTFGVAEHGKGPGVIRCSVRHGNPFRGVAVEPLIQTGDVIYAGRRGTALHEATASLLVTAIYPQRLRDLSQREAHLEGAAAAWCLKVFEAGDDLNEEVAYGTLINEVGPRKFSNWKPHAEDGARPTPRNFFDLNYLRPRKARFQVWKRSPWVWVVGFRWYPMRPADLMARIAAGTLEKKTA